MAKVIRQREKELEKAEMLRLSSEKHPPNSTCFDVRSTMMRSSRYLRPDDLKSNKSLRLSQKTTILSPDVYANREAYSKKKELEFSKAKGISVYNFPILSIDLRKRLQSAKIAHLRGKKLEDDRKRSTKSKQDRLVQKVKEKHLDTKLQLLEKATERFKQNIKAKKENIMRRTLDSSHNLLGIIIIMIFNRLGKAP